MVITENTKLIAKFNPTNNNRGLNIYNPYFQEVGMDAVYLLFHNKDPKPLIEGMRHLSLPGALITGSFESDPRMPDLVDQLDPLSSIINRVGFAINRNGLIIGGYQGAYGLEKSIKSLVDYSDKEICILGAGVVVKGLLGVMQLQSSWPKGLEIYNRTLSGADDVKQIFPLVQKTGTIKDMLSEGTGDIFINATDIGSPWNKGEKFNFPNEFIDRFNYVVDVTFIPLKTPLIETAEKLGKKVSPGHKMFLYQGKYVLEQILNIKVNDEILHRKMLQAFNTDWS